MANTLACTTTDLMKSGMDLYCDYNKDMCPSSTMMMATKLGLDALCHGITLGKVADTFRSTSCQKDGDCTANAGQTYTCNISRGVCEI